MKERMIVLLVEDDKKLPALLSRVYEKKIMRLMFFTTVKMEHIGL